MGRCLGWGEGCVGCDSLYWQILKQEYTPQSAKKDVFKAEKNMRNQMGDFVILRNCRIVN